MFTTSERSGDTKATASFLSSAIDITLSTWVESPGPAIIKPTSTVSESRNFSYAVLFCETVTAEPSEPLCKEVNVGVDTAVYVVPDAVLPQFVPPELWSIQ